MPASSSGAGARVITHDSQEDTGVDWGSDSQSAGELSHLYVLADTESEDEASQEQPVPQPTCLQAFVDSQVFFKFFSGLVVLNLFAMIIQADYRDDRWPQGCKAHECHRVWPYVNLTFLGFFVFEIAMRVLAHGCRHFFVTAPDKPWNIFDFLIVLLGTLDVLARMMRLGHRGGRFIAIARVLRILRVLRIVRLLKTFRQLRMLARGLVESVTVVFWIFFLIVFLIFIYAIFFTDLINHHSHLWGDQEEDVRQYFGTIFLTMFTLFQFVTLDNWVDVDDLLMQKLPWPIQLVIFSFIIIESFVILSLLTGVMADHMDQVRKDEESDMVKSNRGSFDGTRETFKKLFTKKDSEVPYVTPKEFFTVFADRSMAAQLNADDIELTGAEALELFPIFDKDCDGVLMWTEFKTGLEDYREGLTIMQLLELKSIFSKLEREVARSGPNEVPGQGYRKATPSPAAEQELERMEERIADLDKRLSKFDSKVKDIVELYSARNRYGRKPSIRRRANVDRAATEGALSLGAGSSPATAGGALSAGAASPASDSFTPVGFSPLASGDGRGRSSTQP